MQALVSEFPQHHDLWGIVAAIDGGCDVAAAIVLLCRGTDRISCPPETATLQVGDDLLIRPGKHIVGVSGEISKSGLA